ncbi:MAG: rod shape-determining protein RodA [Ignavibacteria bacterium]
MERRLFDKFDIVLFLSVITLVTIGLFAVYSATYASSASKDFFSKQLVFAIIGLVMVIVLLFIPSKYFLMLSYPAYIVSIVLLIAVLIFGKTINGNKSWFYIAGFGIQPSEFAKVATILALSNFLHRNIEGRSINSSSMIFKSVLIILLPAVLIKFQNDTGTTLVFFSFIIPLLFWAGLSPFLLFAIVSPVVLVVLAFLNQYYFYAGLVCVIIVLILMKNSLWKSALVFAINVVAGFSVHFLFNKLQPYQQHRILAVLDPTTDPLGTGYNVIQSKVAIGSGGLFGKGFLQGTQTQLKFIPEQWTDFIFCMIGEEFGLIGGMLVILLFVIIILRFVNIATQSRDSFLSFTCIGIASLILFHLLINVGMTLGIMPVIGIPLPFVSYGVSSLLSFYLMTAIGLNAYKNRKVFL